MSWKIEPKSGDDAWTWATVDGAGAAVGPVVELVCDWAFEAADASPAVPPPAFDAKAEGPFGPAGPITDGKPCVGPAGAAVKPGLTPSIAGNPIVVAGAGAAPPKVGADEMPPDCVPP